MQQSNNSLNTHIPTPFQGDPVSNLPVDQIQPEPHEIQIVNTLFKTHRRTMDVIFEEMKDIVVILILVTLVCILQIDEIIRKLIPITQNSVYILARIKGLLVGSVFWIVKHFYLSQTN